MQGHRRAIGALLLDVTAVGIFVVIGRRNHDEGVQLAGIGATATPFLFGLAAAWFAARAWHHPTSLVTGLAIWPITVLIAMGARRFVFQDGTAASFVVVATLFLGACFVGWRAVALVRTRRAPDPPRRERLSASRSAG